MLEIIEIEDFDILFKDSEGLLKYAGCIVKNDKYIFYVAKDIKKVNNKFVGYITLSKELFNKISWLISELEAQLIRLTPEQPESEPIKISPDLSNFIHKDTVQFFWKLAGGQGNFNPPIKAFNEK